MDARLDSRRYGSFEGFQGSTATASSSSAMDLDVDVETHEPAYSQKRWFKAAAVILGGIAAVSATTRFGPYTARQASSQENLLSATAARPSATTSPPLAFTTVNFYHARDGKPAQLYPWLVDTKLIEPHRDTTLAVANPRQGMGYSWQIRGDSSDSAVHTSASGEEAVVALERNHLGKNLVTLEEVDAATGAVSRRLDEFVMVKYVRREIRTLTDDEREELFDAVSGGIATYSHCCGF